MTKMKLKSALLLSALAMTTANAVAQNQNPIIKNLAFCTLYK